MVASLPMTQVGKRLGVSDNAVRKRLKKRGLG
jgi:DNA-binding Lrp family transcriptional regulator